MSTSTGSANVIPLQIDKSSHARSETLMKESLARLPRPVQRMREVAQSDFKRAIQNLFDHVDDSLFELADRAVSNLEQNVFFESMREIRIQRRAMEKTFLLHIDRHFTGLVEGAEELDLPSRIQSTELDVDTDDLSLVSKEELEELVAIDSLVSKAWAQNKNLLRVLAARINTLVSVAVSEKNNPLTPRTLADSFLEASALITIDIKAKLVLFKLFERYVINELGGILNKVNHALTEEGVPIPKSPTRRSASAPQRSRVPLTEAPVVTSEQSVSNGEAPTGLYATLQSLLETQPQNTRSNFTETSYATHGEDEYPVNEVSYALISALSQLQQQQVKQQQVQSSSNEQGEQPQLLSSGNIQSAIHSVTGEELVDERSQDVIKLVDMLFSFILEDQSLPDPVKLLLSRLQIPFIKVALADEEFFKKEGHPARRLLNEMAMASIGWSGDAESGKRDMFLNKVESTVNKILNEFDSNFEIFTLLLTDFIAFMEKERRRVMLFEKRAIDAEDGKAKSEVGRLQVDTNLDTLIKGRALPESFSRFIKEPWSNILFLIYMRQGKESPQWAQALRVAKELVWSAAAIRDDEHKRKLIVLIPRLKAALKKGLENISFNPVKQAKFIEKFDSHYQALLHNYQQGIAEGPKPTVEVKTELKAELKTEPKTKITVDKLETASSEIGVAPATSSINVTDEGAVIGDGKVHNVAVVNAEVLATPPVEPAVSEPVVDEKGDASEKIADSQYCNLVDNFTVGVWFEKAEEGGTSYRCRLAAIIRATGKYIFVNRAGVKVAEETKVSLAIQLQEGNLRTLDDGMLFDRALESVITNLRTSK